MLPASPDTTKKKKKIFIIFRPSFTVSPNTFEKRTRGVSKMRPLTKFQNCPRTESGRQFTLVLFAFTLLAVFLFLTAQTRKRRRRRRRAQTPRDILYVFNVLSLSMYVV